MDTLAGVIPAKWKAKAFRYVMHTDKLAGKNFT